MEQKLKSFLADDRVFTTLLLVIVGAISFGLGRQSVEDFQVVGTTPAGVVFIEAAEGVSALSPADAATTLQSTPRVVASKTGTKYHLLTCPGAVQIKEENKLYFDSPALAEAAGLQPAANCPGLQ